MALGISAGNGGPGTVTVTNNTGTIKGVHNGIIANAGTVTVDNLFGGTISGGGRGIIAQAVNVTSNDGTIEATSINGSAIDAAVNTATVNNLSRAASSLGTCRVSLPAPSTSPEMPAG